jgi:hypothetical protein
MPLPGQESMLDAMISLARLAKTRRVIVSGSDAFGLYIGLLDRGFLRAATTAISRAPCGQHDAALIAGRYSTDGLEGLLKRVVPFLTARATIAIWIDSGAVSGSNKLQAALERLGFRIEAGTACENGFIVSAQRRDFNPLANAA